MRESKRLDRGGGAHRVGWTPGRLSVGGSSPGVIRLVMAVAALSWPAAQAAEKGAKVATLSGVVLNLASGGLLPEATVVIRELGVMTKTDLDGLYQFEVPEGRYTLIVRKEGFLDQIVHGIQVESGRTNYQDVTLNPERFELGSVTVVAEADEASQAALLVERRAAAVITDGIGVQEMSRNTGSDAADAIQRVTGVSIVDNKFVYIRGLGERYSSTMLNGAVLPSTQPDKKVVPLDLFPSSLLQSIQTEKSYTPDKPGEFSAGLVRLESVSFPRQATLRVSVGPGYDSLTTFKDFMTYPGGDLDFWGFDDGARGLPATIPGNRLVRTSRFTSSGFTPEQLEVFGESFSNVWQPRARDGAPNFKFNVVGGNTFGKLGLVLAAAHSNSYRNRDEVQNVYRVGSGDALTPFHDYEFQLSTASSRTGAAANLGYRLTPGNRLFLRQFYSHDSTDEARLFEGFNGDAENLVRDFRLRFQEESLHSIQAAGEHSFAVFGNSLLEWRVNRARSTLDEPDLREVLYEFSPTQGEFVLANESQSGFRQFSRLAEVLWEPALDWSTFFSRGSIVGSIQVGGSYRQRERDFGARRFRFLPRGRVDANLAAPPEQIFTPENIGPSGFEIREETRPTDTYEASDITRAGYAMADVAWGRWRWIAGARVESNSQRLTTFDLFNRNTATTVQTRLQNSDWLPAINAVYRLGAETNLRGSFSRTLNHPEFRELSTFEFTDVVGGRSVVGNPDLERATIENYDLRWEWFPSGEELVSVSFFHKRFQSPIERVIQPTAQLRTSFVNADGAENTGFEVDFRRNLGFLSSALTLISVSTNYTFVDSRIDILPDEVNVLTSLQRPLAGQSRHVFNGIFEYRHSRGALARLLFNYQGRRITDVGALGLPDIFEEGYPKLDLLIAQPIGESGDWEFKFSAENLLDREVRFTQGGELFRSFHIGRTYSVTLSYSIF